MKKISLLLMVFLLIELFAGFAAAQENKTVGLYLFYGQGCPHCAKLRAYLSEISKGYPTLNIVEKE
ncbi:hypothetical protein DRJ22_03235, partial [Candidatus Woesearchaeota archaeon]